jgi:hypothetical protein
VARWAELIQEQARLELGLTTSLGAKSLILLPGAIPWSYYPVVSPLSERCALTAQSTHWLRPCRNPSKNTKNMMPACMAMLERYKPQKWSFEQKYNHFEKNPKSKKKRLTIDSRSWTIHISGYLQKWCFFKTLIFCIGNPQVNLVNFDAYRNFFIFYRYTEMGIVQLLESIVRRFFFSVLDFFQSGYIFARNFISAVYNVPTSPCMPASYFLYFLMDSDRGEVNAWTGQWEHIAPIVGIPPGSKIRE